MQTNWQIYIIEKSSTFIHICNFYVKLNISLKVPWKYHTSEVENQTVFSLLISWARNFFCEKGIQVSYSTYIPNFQTTMLYNFHTIFWTVPPILKLSQEISIWH